MAGDAFNRVEAAIRHLFTGPDARPNIDALQGWVWGLRRAGRPVESLEEGLRLGLLDDFVSGGAYSGAQSLRRSAWQMYRSLSRAERESLSNQYAEWLEKAGAEFPYVFHVWVINAPSSPADLLVAEQTPGKMLPRLSSDQKEIARAFDISEQEYRRLKAARQFSEERYRVHAQRCWDFVMEAARRHGVNAADIVYDVSLGKFYCELRQDGQARRFLLDAQLLSEPLEQGDRVGLEKARNSIGFAVDQVFASEARSRTA